MTSEFSIECEQQPLNEQALVGEKIMLVGRLSGMPRTAAVQTIRQHGGEVVDLNHTAAATIVLGDEHTSVAAALGKSCDQHQALLDGIAENPDSVIYESELWRRIGLVDDGQVRRLYTPAMLADLIGVPAAAIRHWRRVGALQATRRVRRLSYFDFEEVAIAKRLGQLHAAGCSLRVIDRKLSELSHVLPHLVRPLADSSILVEGRQLVIRRGEELAEPDGQRLFGFGECGDAVDFEKGGSAPASVLPFAESFPADQTDDAAQNDGIVLDLVEQLEQEALDWIDAGEFERAAEAYRTILMANGPSPDALFSLADALYRNGDLAAARERLYSVLEHDEDYVEARANLGCVLAELGELDLAVSAFKGALERHPDFSDVHFHLAGVFDRMNHTNEAVRHYRSFLSLAPESPWAVTARDRLSQLDENPSLAVEPETSLP